MTEKFNKDKLLYKGTASKLSEDDVKSLFSKDFNGSKDFVELYLMYDGIDFMREGKMFRSTFYEVKKNELDEINLSFFFSFKSIISGRTAYNQIDMPSEYTNFAKTHIPFSDDGCGNSIWIDTETGIIKKTRP